MGKKKLAKRALKTAARTGTKVGAPGAGQAWMLYDVAPVVVRTAREQLQDTADSIDEFREAEGFKGKASAFVRHGGRSVARQAKMSLEGTAAALLNPPGLDRVLAALMALQRLAHVAHWEAQGPTSYSDHLLYERIYNEATKKIDPLAELMIGHGDGVRAAVPQATVIYERLVAQGHAGLLFALAELGGAVASAKRQGQPGGVINYLDDLLQKIDGWGYLISQRSLPSARPNGRARPNGSTKAGGYPFARKEAQYREYTEAQLRFAAKDAYAAAQSCRDHDPIAEGWYMDDVSTILAELRRRTARPNRCGCRSNPCNCAKMNSKKKKKSLPKERSWEAVNAWQRKAGPHAEKRRGAGFGSGKAARHPKHKGRKW